MARKILITEANSPLTLQASDLDASNLLATQQTVIICSGNNLQLTLPAISSLRGLPELFFVVESGNITVYLNENDRGISSAAEVTEYVFTESVRGYFATAITGTDGQTANNYWLGR